LCALKALVGINYGLVLRFLALMMTFLR